jgi:hypothetical protein
MYFIITKKKINDDDDDYVDGLNIFSGDFDNNPELNIYFNEKKYGFCFYDEKTILEACWLFRSYLRIVTLPTSEPNFQLVQHKDMFRTNMVILGEKILLSDITTIKYLWNCGVSIVDSKQKITDWACHDGHVEILIFMLNNGADIVTYFQDLLWDASTNGNCEIVRILLENKTPGTTIDDDELIKDTLQWTISYMDKKIIRGRERTKNYFMTLKLLIEHGAAVNNVYRDTDLVENFADIEYTLLELACEHNKFDIAQLLLDNGADVNANNGCALYNCYKNNNLEMAKWLLKNGANANNCFKNCNLKITEWLLKNGSNNCSN